MKSIGVRQLKEHTSELLHQVEEGETIEVTVRGKPVARLVPVETPGRDEEMEQFWREVDDLAERIGKAWSPKGMSAVEAVREVRSHDYDSP
jgi:prevent-host-death family protein